MLLAVVTAASALVAVICACFAGVCWKKSRQAARELRSLTSMQGELHEIRDYVTKIDAWSKRLNARLLRREERDAKADTLSEGELSRMTDKRELRRRLGIVPGQPLPHR